MTPDTAARTSRDRAIADAWRQSRTRVFLDAHTPDWADPHQRGAGDGVRPGILSASDPVETIRRIADIGADSVVLFAKCQYGNSYYPSAVGRQHSALQGRDLFGSSLAEAHRRGLKVIAYFSNMWDTATAGRNPEWELRTPVGLPSTGRWPTLCLLSPYRNLAMSHVREIAERYPIDGLWSDILTVGPCVCARCEAAFHQQTGLAMPQTPRDHGWVELVRFSNRILTEYLEEQRAILRDVRPSAALVPNFYGTTFVDAVSGLTTAHLDLADIGSTEGYTDWHGLAFPSFAARYIRAGVYEGPAEVLVGRFVHTWDFTIRSVAQLRYEAFTAAANGVCVTVDDQPYADGSLEPEVYRRLGSVFGEIRDRQAYLLDAEPYRYAALYVSQRSRELESLLGTPENPSTGEPGAQFPPSRRRDWLSDLHAAVTGTYRALLEEHLPVDMVDDRPASLERLGRYRVLVLPDVLSLSDSEVDALEAFVEAGGSLVVTGPTAVLDDSGERASSPRVERLLGVRSGTPTGPTYPYLRLVDAALVAAVGDWPIPHYGSVAALAPIDPELTVLATRTDPVLETSRTDYWHNNQPAPLVATSDPAIVERRVGEARVITSAARLGNNHGRLGHSAYRDLLGTLVRRAAGSAPPGEVLDGHRNTELALAVQGSALVAHLVTGHPVRGLDLYGVRQPGTIEDVARTSRITLRLADASWTAERVLPGGTTEPLPVSSRGDVDVRDAGDWETVVLRR